MLKNQNLQINNSNAPSKHDFPTNQTNNDQGAYESKMIMKPFIYQGPTPGQTMRDRESKVVSMQSNSSRISMSDNGGQK